MGIKKILGILLLVGLLAGCALQQGQANPSQPPQEIQQPATDPSASSAHEERDSSSPQPTPADLPQEDSDVHPYLNQLVEVIVKEISTPEMSQYQRAKAAFDYIVQHTVVDQPIGLDLWRVHGGGEAPLPFLQQRALSPLRFGVGMCEDYAAALTLLLQGMGLEAQYVPGLTYSAEGNLVDHAWTAVRIDGDWYHLDSQLEDNISRHGSVRYKYFLRGDATLSGSHLWGQRLIDSGLLTAEQNEKLAANYLLLHCPQDYPTPNRLVLEETPPPDLDALRQEADAEIGRWEAENGPLTEMNLDTIPPVFGLEGYGPADEG